MTNAQFARFRPIHRAPRMISLCRWSAFVVCAVIAGVAGAQQETLGSILDKGAKKMQGSAVRTAIAGGMPKSIRPYPEAEDVTFSMSDGSMKGYFAAYNVWATGSWEVDDQGRLCFDGFSGWVSEVCYHWFKLGDAIYLLQSDSDSDREQGVAKLDPS